MAPVKSARERVLALATHAPTSPSGTSLYETPYGIIMVGNGGMGNLALLELKTLDNWNAITALLAEGKLVRRGPVEAFTKDVGGWRLLRADESHLGEDLPDSIRRICTPEYTMVRKYRQLIRHKAITGVYLMDGAIPSYHWGVGSVFKPQLIPVQIQDHGPLKSLCDQGFVIPSGPNPATAADGTDVKVRQLLAREHPPQSTTRH